MALTIKPHLKAAGMRQVDLATRLEITESHLSNMIRGNRQPSPALLQRMAVELGVRVSDILEDGPSGMAESGVTFSTAPQTQLHALCRALQIKCRAPALYMATKANPALAIAKGDSIIADMQQTARDTDTVIATIADTATGASETDVFRRAGRYLVPGDPSKPVIQIDSSGSAAIIAPVAAIFRAT